MYQAMYRLEAFTRPENLLSHVLREFQVLSDQLIGSQHPARFLGRERKSNEVDLSLSLSSRSVTCCPLCPGYVVSPVLLYLRLCHEPIPICPAISVCLRFSLPLPLFLWSVILSVLLKVLKFLTLKKDEVDSYPFGNVPD